MNAEFNNHIINSFPGYEFIYDQEEKKYKNMYRGVDLGFGGYVYSEPGMYGNVALLDVQSMHPNSAVNLNAFGDYTQRFKELLDARIAIKHKDYEAAGKLLDGKLKPYLKDKDSAKALSQALKIAINSVYGLTSAKFENAFKDTRNKNNIVALRGALFMKTLQDEVQKRGFIVAHIKTDSIKIPDATPEIIEFVMDFGKKYGYTFEHEATYDRMCLANKAVYIAKYADIDRCYELYGKEYVDSKYDICKENKEHSNTWTATGAQFQEPYVFKKLFSKESLEFKDLCQTKSVTSALHLDMNEDLGEDEHKYIFVGKVGNFCPIKPGCGGGLLMRENRDKDGNVKYDSAVGADGYRWLESEFVKEFDKQKDIDYSFYESLANAAIDEISKHGDFEWFVSDDPYVGPKYTMNGKPIYHPEDDDDDDGVCLFDVR